MNAMKRFFIYSLVALLGSATLVGCAIGNIAKDPQKMTEFIQAPQMHDIYLAKCASFLMDDVVKKYPYCYIRIIDIQPNDITFVLADRLMPKADKETIDKLDKLQDFAWLPKRTFAASPDMLVKMHMEGMILRIKRLTKDEVHRAVTSVSRQSL